MRFNRIIASLKDFDKNILNFMLLKFIASIRKNPLGVSVDISGSCNLNCRICSLEKWYPKNNNKTIPYEVIEKISHIIPKIKSISLFCNCEPLLNQNITEIIKHFKEINPNLFISFATNGTLLSSSLSSKLVETGIDKIYFSIDGASAETNDEIRLGAKLQNVVQNIKELNKQKEAKQSNIPKTGIITVSSTKNVNELVSILQLACELCAESFTINGLDPYDEEMANLTLWRERINPEFKRIFVKLKELAKKNDIDIRLPSLILQPYKFCVLMGCVIDSNGEVYPCSSLSYERPYYYLGNELIHTRISFGNLQENNFYEIWNSREYRSFRKKLLRGHLPDFCSKCLMQNRVLCP